MPEENEIIKEFEKLKHSRNWAKKTIADGCYLHEILVNSCDMCWNDIQQFILTKLKEQAHDILETKNAELKEEYQRGYNKGVLDHSARLEDVINEASEKARQEGYEVGFAQAESGLPNPMIEFIRKDERIKRDEEIAMLLENIVMNHVEETNNSLHVRMLKKIINNLKN